jgi:hypothetical protein
MHSARRCGRCVAVISGAAAIFLLAACDTTAPASKVDVRDTPYGVAIGPAPTSNARLRDGLHISAPRPGQWLRFSIPWAVVERDSGTFDWTDSDSIVAAASDNGMRLLAVLGGTPMWESTAPPSVLEDGLGTCGTLKYRRYPPKDYAAWTRFVSAAVARYGGRVAAWEIWNEPDLAGSVVDGQPCTGGSWCGTPHEYAHLLASAAATIRQQKSSATVVLGGLANVLPADTNFLREILSDTAYPAARYFDIANFHFYLDPGAAASSVNRLRDILQSSGATARPTWVTETGSSSFGSEDSQADYLGRVMPALTGAGAERVFWWRLFDPIQKVGACGNSPPAPGFGLLRADFTPKPALSELGRIAEQWQAVSSR